MSPTPAPSNGAPRRPPVVLTLFDPTTDLAARSRVRVLAFSDTEVNQRMFPPPRPPVDDRIRYDIRNETRAYVGPNVIQLTARVDGLPVGFAVYVSPVDRTATQGDDTPDETAAAAAREKLKEDTKEDIDREIEKHMDLEFVKVFKKALGDKRKERFGGKAVWVLDLLCVDPEYQALGVGKKLLEWGFARADQDQLPLYLEATPAGEPVYKRYGFDIVGRVDCKDRAGITLSGPTMERTPRALPASFVLPPPSTGKHSAIGKGEAQEKKPKAKLDFVDSEMDWPPLVEARLAAFEGTPINERLHPIERRPPLKTRIAAEVQRHIQEERFRKASTFNVKATIDGVPVGLAVWHAAPDRTATQGEPTNADRAESDEKNAALKALSEDFKEYSDSMDFAFLGRFKGAMEEARKGHYRGKPHWHLSMLFVKPEWQGFGVGHELLQWGLTQADLRRLPAYLESSAAGKPVYEKAGFEVINEIAWDDVDGSKMTMPAMERLSQPLPVGVQKPTPLIKKPSVVISEVTPDDWAAMGRTKILSLGAEGRLFNSINPPHLQPDLETRVRWFVHTQQQQQARIPSSTPISVMKATIDNKLVGFGVWHLPVHQPQLSSDSKPLSSASDSNLDLEISNAIDHGFLQRWKKAAADKRSEMFKGKKHLYLELLAVHPDYHGLGIGKALVQWGNDKADQAGVSSYLEASRKGFPLYQYLGFSSVGDISVQVKEDDIVTLPAMVRPPKSTSTDSALRKTTREIVLSLVDPEVDRAPLARIRQSAFVGSDVVEHLYKAECVPSLEERIDGTIRSETRSEPFLTSETIRVKATIDGRPVGFAVWKGPVDRTSTGGDALPEEVNRQEQQDAVVEATKQDVDRQYSATINKDFHSALGRAFDQGRKKQYGGRPHLYLTMIAVDPEYQGVGVGKKLLDHGLAYADLERLHVYLEASLEGLKFYESRGFGKIAELDLSEGVIHPALERQPQPLPSDFQLPLPLLTSLSGHLTKPTRPGEEVEIGLVEEKDWSSLFACDFAGMEGDVFGETIAPVHLRPDLETRTKWALYTQRRTPKSVLDNTVYLKATLPSDPSRVVGYAIWKKPSSTSTASQLEEDKITEPLDAALEEQIAATENRAFLKDFKGRAREVREKYHEGRPHWQLSPLVVHPDYQGLGIGKKLLYWGLNQADSSSPPLSVHLESSPVGEKVYPRYGFQLIERIPWVDVHGRETDSPAFVRPARSNLPVEAASLLPEPGLSTTSLPSTTTTTTTTTTTNVGGGGGGGGRQSVEVGIVEDCDWPSVFVCKFASMEDDPLAETASPKHLRPDLETRIKWALYTQSQIPPSTLKDYLYIKATLPSNPAQVVGFAIWELPHYDSSTSSSNPSSSSPADDPSNPSNPSSTTPTVDAAHAEVLNDRTDEELEALIASTENRAFLKDFKGRARRIREKYHQGNPHWYLSLLVVHPDFQGLGIGKSLILHGLSLADSSSPLPLPVHLESSPMGEKVYPKFGFEEVGRMDWVHVSGKAMGSPSFVRLAQPHPSPPPHSQQIVDRREQRAGEKGR